MRSHEWRDHDEHGEQRLLRARQHAGRWQLEARLKSDSGFQRLDPPPLHDLEMLLEIVSAKYRRGRAPHEHIAELQALVDAARAREGQPDGDG